MDLWYILVFMDCTGVYWKVLVHNVRGFWMHMVTLWMAYGPKLLVSGRL